MEKTELIITALQQRIGEMAASYELEKAMLRAEYTQILQELETYKDQVSKAEYSKEVLDAIQK